MSSRVRDIVFGILSFFLSLLFTLFSFILVIESTLMNKNAWIDNMNRSNYFIDKTDEVRDKLKDLTYASGIKEDFFDGFVDEILVTEDTYNYIEGYFEGTTTVIDGTAFRQKMSVALDEYVKKTNQKVDSEQISELIKQAEHIYTATVAFVGFGSLSVYFLAAKKVLPLVLTGIIVLSLGLIAVLFFCNKWKHRAMKYYYYATGGAFLANLALTLFLSISGGAKNINLDSRSVYNFVVSFVNSVNLSFWICTALFLLFSVALYFVYLRLFKNASKRSGI